MKKAVFFLAVALLVSMVCNYKQCASNDGTADPIDFVLTVAGVNIGYLLKLGFIATL
jgi:hypothetical protein